MQAFAGTSFDSLDSYALTELPVPEPGPGQVRLRVAATALGYVDGLMAQGRYQIKPPLPYVPGGEIAGVLEAVGAGVSTLAVGDRVVTWQLGGGMADCVVVDAADVDVVPGDLPLPVAAAMLVDYQTAHFALFERGRLSAADRVLVLGAAGGVGAAAVALAARAGAFVIAAAGADDKRQAARALGAQATVDYRQHDWREALKACAPGGAVDVVVDPVGGDAFEPAFRSLAKDGRHLALGFAGGAIGRLPANLALLKNADLLGVDVRHFLATQPERARQVRGSLFRRVRDGVLPLPGMTRFTLAQAADALRATLSRERRGKVVVVPQGGVADTGRLA